MNIFIPHSLNLAKWFKQPCYLGARLKCSPFHQWCQLLIQLSNNPTTTVFPPTFHLSLLCNSTKNIRQLVCYLNVCKFPIRTVFHTPSRKCANANQVFCLIARVSNSHPCSPAAWSSLLSTGLNAVLAYVVWFHLLRFPFLTAFNERQSDWSITNPGPSSGFCVTSHFYRQYLGFCFLELASRIPVRGSFCYPSRKQAADHNYLTEI